MAALRKPPTGPVTYRVSQGHNVFTGPVLFGLTLVAVFLITFLATGWALRHMNEGNGVSPDAWRQACDVVVHDLLTAHDAVDLQRAGILAGHLRCDVVKRAVPVLVGFGAERERERETVSNGFNRTGAFEEDELLTNSRKIAVVGNAGGGKSWLSRKIAAKLEIPYHSIDAILWQPNWVPLPAAQFTKVHCDILGQPAWVIDGFGRWDSLEARCMEADTIIFVDHPLWIHYWWAVKRQLKCILVERKDGPAGCPMLPKTVALFRMMRHLHKEYRSRLLALLAQLSQSKQVVHITSPRELNQFARSLVSDNGFAFALGSNRDPPYAGLQNRGKSNSKV